MEIHAPKNCGIRPLLVLTLNIFWFSSTWPSHSWRCPPSFSFRPSPSFCDGASLDGNDFRCETIGCKVEKETQEEEVVRFIFLQMTRADGRRRGKVSNPPREIKRRRKHFFFVRGVARAEPYPPSKPRQNH